MSEMEEKMGSILSDPTMMQQIMSMAQMLSGSQQEEKPQEKPKEKPMERNTESQGGNPLAQINPAMLQSIAGIARQGGVDKNQQTLLKALQPYLSTDRIRKLERAMHAARMAGAASAFLNNGGLQLLTGR